MNKNDKQRLKPKQSYNTYLDDLDDFNHCAVKMQEVNELFYKYWFEAKPKQTIEEAKQYWDLTILMDMIRADATHSMCGMMLIEAIDGSDAIHIPRYV